MSKRHSKHKVSLRGNFCGGTEMIPFCQSISKLSEDSEARVRSERDREGEQESMRLIVDAAKSLRSCPTLCGPIDSSPPDSPVPGILQATTLE